MNKLKILTSIFAIIILQISGFCQISKAPSYSAISILEFSRTEYSKIWVSNENGEYKMRTECVGKNGAGNDCTGKIIIYRSDSSKIYIMERGKSTITSMPMKSSDINNPTDYMNEKVFGFDYEQTRTSSKESLGIKKIEGYECVGIKKTTTTVYKDGHEDIGCIEIWKCPSLYDLTILDKNGCGYGEGVLTINYKFAPQPEELFEIPKDAKIMDMGSLMSRITGSNSQEVNNNYVNEKEKALQDAQKDTNEKLKGLNDPNKSKEEKMQDALKILQELDKK